MLIRVSNPEAFKRLPPAFPNVVLQTGGSSPFGTLKVIIYKIGWIIKKALIMIIILRGGNQKKKKRTAPSSHP